MTFFITELVIHPRGKLPDYTVLLRTHQLNLKVFRLGRLP